MNETELTKRVLDNVLLMTWTSPVTVSDIVKVAVGVFMEEIASDSDRVTAIDEAGFV